MVLPPLGEASWSVASSASPPSRRPVSRKRPFNRVPPLAREEPALMLSGLSNLRLIPRKEGVPSRVDARRGAALPQGTRHAKNDLIPTSQTRGKARTRPAPAPGPRRQTSGQPRQRGTSLPHRAHTGPSSENSVPSVPPWCNQPQSVCPQLRASPDPAFLHKKTGNTHKRGAQSPQPAQRPAAQLPAGHKTGEVKLLE